MCFLVWLKPGAEPGLAAVEEGRSRMRTVGSGLMCNLVLSLIVFYSPFLLLAFWQCQLPSLQPRLVLRPKYNFLSWWLSWVPAALLTLCFPIYMFSACALQPLNLIARPHNVWKALWQPPVSRCWCSAAQPFLGRGSHSFGASAPCYPLTAAVVAAVHIALAFHCLMCPGSWMLERLQHTSAPCLPFPDRYGQAELVLQAWAPLGVSLIPQKP